MRTPKSSPILSVLAWIVLCHWVSSGWAASDVRLSGVFTEALAAAYATASQSASPKTVPRMSQKLANEPAPYLRSKLGVWTPAEAEKEFGEPTRRRATRDDKGNVRRDIRAYKHPGFLKVELAYDPLSRRLTDIYFYPVNLEWAEAKKLFGTNYSETKNEDGSTFRSYREARTNLLVSQSDKVVSIGIY